MEPDPDPGCPNPQHWSWPYLDEQHSPVQVTVPPGGEGARQRGGQLPVRRLRGPPARRHGARHHRPHRLHEGHVLRLGTAAPHPAEDFSTTHIRLSLQKKAAAHPLFFVCCTKCNTAANSTYTLNAIDL